MAGQPPLPGSPDNGLLIYSGFSIQHQRMLVALMLVQPKFAISNLSAISPNHFDLEAHRYLTSWIFDFCRANHGHPPSRAYLEFVISDVNKDNEQRQQALMVELDACYRTPMDGVQDVTSRYLEWCRSNRLKEVCFKALDDLQKGKEIDVMNVTKNLRDADAFVSSQADLGVRLFTDDAHTKAVLMSEMDRRPLATGDTQFDKKLAGGPGIGEMLLYLAPPKTGKTTRMLHDAKGYAKQGLPGCFITGEQEAGFLAKRFLESVTGYKTNVFRDYPDSCDPWVTYLDQAYAPVFMQRMTKFGPMDVMRYVERCSAEIGEPMRWCVVDYLNLMLQGGKHELRHELAALARDLRSVFVDLDVVGITATQTNRQATEKELISKDDVGECYELIGIADIIVGIAQPEELAKKRLMNLYGSANRVDEGFWKLQYKTELSLARLHAIETGIDTSSVSQRSIPFGGVGM